MRQIIEDKRFSLDIVKYKSDTSPFGKVIDLGMAYTPGLCFYPINEQLAVYGYSSEYKLFVIDRQEIWHTSLKWMSPLPLFLGKKSIKYLMTLLSARKSEKQDQNSPRMSLKNRANFQKIWLSSDISSQIIEVVSMFLNSNHVSMNTKADIMTSLVKMDTIFIEQKFIRLLL
jgi:hypothetical protein